MDLDLRSQLVNGDFVGELLNDDQSNPTLAGNVDLDVPSVAKLLGALGSGGGLEHLDALKLKGKINANAKRAKFTGVNLTTEGMTGNGGLTLNYAGAKPNLSGNLAFNQLDVNRLMGLTPEAANQQAQWSTETIDFSGLKSLNANLNFTAKKLFFQNFKFGQSAIGMTIKNGILTADLKNAKLYNGSGSGAVKVDARKANAVVTSKLTLDNLLMLPFLTDLADLSRLEGLGRLTYNVRTSGRSENQLVKNLNGTSTFKVIDGAWRGVNLAEMSRTVQGFLGQGGQEDDSAGQDSVGDNEKTDFAELAATFNIKNGIIQNSDFKLLNPFLRVLGQGQINLVEQNVNFKLKPKFVKSARGQGGASDLTGVVVPILLEGPIWDIRYRADMAGILTSVLVPGAQDADPEDALKGLVQDKLGEFLGGKKDEETATETEQGTEDGSQQTAEQSEPETPPEEEDKDIDAGDILRGILKRTQDKDN